MSSLDKAFDITIDNAQYFASDLDVILAASTICDHVTVTLSEETHRAILKNKIYAKQFSSLPEFGVKVFITQTTPPTSVIYIKEKEASLINYDELVDLFAHSQDGIHNGNARR